jgi:hypothetical protein
MDHPDSLAPSPASNFQLAQELIHEHGNIQAIPEGLLEAIGYYRAGDGTIAPVGYEVKILTLEDKEARKPFEPFSVVINAERAPRPLDANLQWRATKIIDKIQIQAQIDAPLYAINNDPDHNVVYRADWSEIVSRAEWLAPWLILPEDDFSANTPDDEILLFQLCEGFAAPSNLYPTLSNEAKLVFDERNSDSLTGFVENANVIYSEEEVWPTAATVQLSEVTEWSRSQLADLDKLYEFYDNALGFNKPLIGLFEKIDGIERFDFSVKERVKHYAESLIAKGVDTEGKLLMLAIGRVLDDLFPNSRAVSFTEDTMNISGAAEAADYLKDAQVSIQNIEKEELKAAKANLRNVPFGNSGRGEAEDRLQRAKRQLKDINAKFLPLVEAFERPKLAALNLNRLFDDLQSVLLTSTTEENTYTFDSGIDETLDADPGVVSGDCTEGNPLPFLDPYNGLYNVKVFCEGSHVGNIYLLQVNGKNGEPLVWHLDAIQIPKYIDWSKAAPAILGTFKEQAKDRGVKRITINGQDVHISNYDYISEAFQNQAIERIDSSNKLFRAIKKAAPRPTSDDENNGLQVHSDTSLLRIM